MIQKLLDCHPFELLRTGHLLADVVMLFSSSGSWGAPRAQASERAVAYLAFAPSEKIELSTVAQIEQFRLKVASNSQASSTDAHPGGWMGYFTYEAGCALQGVGHDASVLGRFGYYPLIVELNFSSGESIARWDDQLSDEQVAVRLDKLQRVVTEPGFSCAAGDQVEWKAAWTEGEYRSAFQSVKDYLAAGDSYQVNLTMPFSTHANLTGVIPAELFEVFGPAFGAYTNLGGHVIASVSPERFISVSDGKIETCPIKGTVARGKDQKADLDNIQWLRSSLKNQAENLMIVDLLRNDLSMNAEPHSVTVSKLFDIETHANVHHMVSTICAELPSGRTAADVIIDALPGGSITGAPKKRAMEIIRELEVGPRGAYCGVLGYFNRAGGCDFNILIRTIEANAEGARCWAGGGIVYDSVPDEEWQELHTKVRQLLDWTSGRSGSSEAV